jgi:hypothetical protein
MLRLQTLLNTDKAQLNLQDHEIDAIHQKYARVAYDIPQLQGKFNQARYLLDALKFRPVVVEFGSFYLRASIQGPNG